MGNSSSVNKHVSIEIEKLEQLKLNNLSMKKQVATLKEHIEKEGRLIAELREHIDLLKKDLIMYYYTFYLYILLLLFVINDRKRYCLSIMILNYTFII